MKCPECGNPATRVIETREVDGYTMRYRFCRACGAQFRTHERQVWNAGKNRWSTTPVALEGDE